ncbi:class E sortase [Streptomyces aureoverticillatus]|uniref:class E sortase n=1 Tax=Streptomyces aureoverticillatus TaxID=66871 RepID=UPI0013DA4B79|nr:class E sortase [Streptomyces aureoverticillatus]QIB44690.1 class E sortase [Streptomyces aureoverticillatus]
MTVHGGGDAAAPGEHPSPWFRSGSAPPGGEVPDSPAPYTVDSPETYTADSPDTYTAAYEAPRDDETIGLRTADTRRIAGAGVGEPEADVGAVVPGGRAARRKAAAAKHRGRRGAKPAASGTTASGSATATPPAAGKRPLTRLEARRAERAAKPGPATVASRAIGELFITIGVLMLLFVTYQLWWTNIRAQQQADAEARKLQENWAKGKGKPGSFEPGQGFALLHIPKLDVVTPVAEGIDKQKVLDRGMVGHYNKGSTKTPMPEANPGNFAVAGHRNTHGEPFRYINRLEPGDPIVVETQDRYFVYKMASILPQTGPDNTKVLNAVPPGSGFTKPGRYITLTTCTPEFTSKYRMIVWGKMVEDRPRAKGKPPALVD